MTNNVNVQDLDFNAIKQSLKTSLESQDRFQDYNFEGASLSLLLDLHASVAHYNAFYAHMLNNESNIDSAVLESSMFSKAKFHNYLPGGRRSAEAYVNFKIPVNAGTQPQGRRFVIERGTTIKSNNNTLDARTFVVKDDIYLYDKSIVNNIYDYQSGSVAVYEGSFQSERYLADTTLLNQRFILEDPNVDITTLNIRVYKNRNSSEFVVYKLASDYMNVDGKSPVFWVSKNEDGLFELSFGNGVYGRKLENDNLVEASYISCNGEDGNNSKVFVFGGELVVNDVTYTVNIETVAPSEGGMEPETVDELRFNIPNHFRAQDRAVSVDDYKSLLISQYRNINSINVWGGEDNIPPADGKVFVCIKPKFGEVLSNKAKNTIVKDILKPRNLPIVDVDVIDPTFLYLNIKTNLTYNPLLTDRSSSQIKHEAEGAIDKYNNNVLNRFDGFFSSLVLNTHVQNTNPSIETAYTTIQMEKRIDVILNARQSYSIVYTSPIVKGTVKSSEFMFRLRRSYFEEDANGIIRIWAFNEDTNKFEQYVDERFGDVDHAAGTVRLTDFEVSSVLDEKLSVYANPELPDLFTKQNNIVLINTSEVTAVAKSNNENEK